MDVLKENPFVVLTPDDKGEEKVDETTNAEIIHKLFVNVFEDFKTIPQQGHVFLNGPRGSGKSMMFRFLLPDCQLIDQNVSSYKELSFFSIHIPIKLTSINNPEFELIKNYGNTIFNEHILTLYFAEVIFDSFSRLYIPSNIESAVLIESKKFFHNVFLRRLRLCGWDDSKYESFNLDTVEDVFKTMKDICSDSFIEATNFLKRTVVNYINSSSQTVPYNGALCDYLSFLFPILKEIKSISLFPNKPIFLLVDDADNLTETQTIVLNSWVSYRTNTEVSLKISTQLNYKTYNTINGTNIDSPHDYYDINILTVYSSSTDHYNKRVRQIIKKRLEFFFDREGVEPDQFFPVDLKQEAEIEKIKNKIRDEYEISGRGYRVNDDVQRYAVPNYIRGLKGQAKSGHTYSYSGFNQLVSISSGIIRHFLTPAAKMFNAELRKLQLEEPNTTPQNISQISTTVQNEEIRRYSTSQLFDEYDKLKKDISKIESDNTYLSKITKLKNLIDGLGGLFHQYLISEDRSERRIFSFAISDTPDPELLEVISLGVRFGYFHKATIGKKNGSGKTRLYILSRILAPHFLLDPTSFAGYKFFTSDRLSKAMHKPDTFIQSMIKVRESDEDKETLQAKIEFNDPIEN